VTNTDSQATDPLTLRQKEVYETYKLCDYSETKTAKKLDLSNITIRKHLFYIARKGIPICPDRFCEQAPVGFGLDKSTIQINKDGQIVQRWDRVSPDKYTIDLFIEALKDRTPENSFKIDPPMGVKEGMAFVWPNVDMHIGMIAKPEETLGKPFDLKIAKKLHQAANKEMFSKIGPVDHIHLAFLGDTVHVDNKSFTTPKNNNLLDAAGSYKEIIWACRDILCDKIDAALTCARTVSVDILPGNHDLNTAVCLAAIMGSYYRSEPRLSISPDTGPFKFFQWGGSFIMGCHGDEAKPNRLAMFLMDYVIQNEIKAKELYIFKGHIHNKKTDLIPGITETDGGVMVETFQTLIPNDAWHTSKAYSSKQATTGKLFHKEYGLIDNFSVSLKLLSCKYGL